MGINNVTLMGRMVAYPELKHTPSNKSVLSFTVAVDKRKKDGGADFIDCVAWEGTADFIAKYFKKGDMIAVCGRIENRTWTNQQGEKRKATEVIVSEASFCGTSGGRTNEGNDRPPMPTERDMPPERQMDVYADFGDDDIPF